MATELKFDTRAINDAIPIKEALRQYAGVDVDAQKGKKIRCISKDHPDNSPSMDVYEKSSRGGNNCFCQSCHASFTPIGVALEYSNRDFRSTVEQMLNDFGLDVYQYSNKAEVERERGYKRSGKKEEIFPLNAEDLELIGLKYANGGSVKQQINIDENGMPVMGIMNVPSLHSQWRENKSSVEATLLDCCDCKLSVLNENIQLIEARKREWELMPEERKANIQKCFNAIEKNYDAYVNGRLKVNDKIKADVELMCEQAWIPTEIENLRDSVARVEAVKEKITSAQTERAKKETMKKNKQKWAERD